MKKIIVFLFSFYMPFVHCKELEVIYDSGNTFSVNKYYGNQNIPEKHEVVSEENKINTILSFPIKTPNMSPGKFKSIDKHIPHLQIPLFIIGDDDFSKKWLLTRKSELIRLNAVGMLIKANDIETVKEIQNIATGLKIYPASGKDIAQQLDIHHYPALISRFGIEQ